MKKTALTILIVLTSLSGFPLFGLTFDEILDTIDENYDMQSALMEVNILEAEARAAASPEDIRIDLDPSLKATSINRPVVFTLRLFHSSPVSLRLTGLIDFPPPKAANKKKLASL